MSTIFENKDNALPTNQEGSVNINVASNEPTPASNTDPFADLLSTVINDKGEPKYASTPEALKGLAHSQAHIKKLEEELAKYREEIEKRKSVEDALTEFTRQPEPDVTPTNGLDEETVAKIVQQRLEETERNKRVKENTTRVVTAIQEKFGEKAEEVFYGKAKELGMTNEQFNQLAAQSPNAVLAFFNVQTNSPVPSRQSSINTFGLRDEPKPIPTIMDGGEERIFLPRGEQSVLVGATHKDLMSEFARHKAAVYAKYGLTV